MNTLNPAKPSPWPRVIIGAFIVLAVGNAFILYLALSTKVASIDEQPYEAGLQYETTITERQAAAADGVSVKFEPSETGVRVFLAGLRNERSWNCEIELIRPNDPTLDQKVSLTGVGPQFDFPLRFTQPGLWLIRLRVMNNSKRYYFEDRLIL